MNGIKDLRTARGWSMAQLAEKLQTTTSTVNRLEKGEAGLDVDWLDKLAAVFGVDWYAVAGRSAARHGMTEDAAPFDPEPGSPLDGLKLGENRDVWTVKTTALDAIGLKPGDQIIVDISARVVEAAGTGDAVIIQVIDPRDPMKATTLLRQYIEPDMFVTNSKTDNAEPLFRGRHDVRVKGVVVKHIAAFGRH